MSKHIALSTFSLLSSLLPGLARAQTADHPTVADSTTAGLSNGANVRVVVPGIGPDWVKGVVGRGAGDCTIILVEAKEMNGGRMGVFLGAATAIQVEFRDSDSLVKWKPVAIKAARAAEQVTCETP